MVNNYGITDRINPSPPRTPGKLREFAGRQRFMRYAIEFLELFNDYTAGRHIDPQGKCFRCENDF